MTLETYLAFVTASVLLIMLPGPNVAVIVANSVRHGARRGLVTVAGTTSAAVIQVTLTIIGLAGALSLLAGWLDWIKWIGVAYLAWLGYRAWRAPTPELTAAGAALTDNRGGVSAFSQGFLVSLTNPKTMLFYSAFLPQFVSSTANAGQQLVLLGATFVVLALALDSVWAVMADRARHLIASRARLINRISGGIFMSAAFGLALARRP